MKKHILLIVICISIVKIASCQWKEVGTFSSIGCLSNLLVINDTFVVQSRSGGVAEFYISFDNGNAWSKKTFDLNDFPEDVVTDGVNIYTINKSTGEVYMSDDLASTWVSFNSGLSGSFDYSTLVEYDGDLYLYGSLFFKLQKGKKQWEDISFSDEELLSVIAFGDTIISRNVVRKSDGMHERFMYTSYSGGQDWHEVENIEGLGNNSTSKMFKYNNILFIAGMPNESTGNVYTSIDYGKTWQAANGLDDKGYNTASSFVSYNESIFCSTDNGVYQSDDFGLNWTDIGLSNVSKISVVGETLFACTCDDGILKRALSDLFTMNVEVENVESFSIYPNPSSNKLNFQIKKQDLYGDAIVTLYTIQGEKIYQQKVIEGNNKIDVGEFMNGVYIFKLENNNKVYTSRFIKQ